MIEPIQPRVSLWVLLGRNWYLNGCYTDLNAMVRAVKQLCQNPDVNDFRVNYEL